MAVRHWLQLAMTDGLGPILTGRLIDSAGSAQAACAYNQRALQTIEGIGSAKSAQIAASLRAAANLVDDEIARCQAQGVRLICRDDEIYPVVLRSIPDPPAVLYVMGTIEPRDLNAVAVVGSRRCSHYGREQAERFGALLAGAGVTVVSGGARGVDSAAHRGALSHPAGRTIAVLGSGLDVPYPPENKSLFELIAAKGAVISEFPLGTPPLKENFPRRNRIVSGLSRGVLVIEADVRSGALITARQACDDHSRPVFALPGRVDNAMSLGPHELIRDGATLVTKLEDVLDGLGPLPEEAMHAHAFTGKVPDAAAMFDAPAPSVEIPPSHPRGEPTPATSQFALSDRQKQILQAIDHDSADVESIVQRSALPAEQVLQELTLLTLRGVIKRVGGQTFKKR